MQIQKKSVYSINTVVLLLPLELCLPYKHIDIVLKSNKERYGEFFKIKLFDYLCLPRPNILIFNDIYSREFETLLEEKWKIIQDNHIRII